MQMQGVRCAAVVFHRKRLTTQQLHEDRLALQGEKNKIFLDHFCTHAVENNISQLFHNLSHLTFLKIPLSFFVRNAG